MRHYSDIIIAPVITEKSMANRQNNVYTFKVVKDANKAEKLAKTLPPGTFSFGLCEV